MSLSLLRGLKAYPVEAFISLPPLVGETLRRAYQIPTPASFSIITGIKEKERVSASGLGVLNVSSVVQDEEKPRVKLGFPLLNLPVIGLKLGRLFAIASNDVFFARNGWKLNKQVYPAVASGYDGYGIAADDASAICYVYINGISVQVNRVTYSTFDATVANTFAVGANGAFKFANVLGAASLVAGGVPAVGAEVSVRVPYNVSNAAVLGETPIGTFALDLTLIDVDNQVYKFYAPSCTTVLDGGTLDFGADTQDIEFRLQFDGSRCTPFDFSLIKQLRAC